MIMFSFDSHFFLAQLHEHDKKNYANYIKFHHHRIALVVGCRNFFLLLSQKKNFSIRTSSTELFKFYVFKQGDRRRERSRVRCLENHYYFKVLRRRRHKRFARVAIRGDDLFLSSINIQY